MPASSIDGPESRVEYADPPAASAPWNPSWRKAPPTAPPVEKAPTVATTHHIGAPLLVLGLLIGAGASAFALCREQGVLLGQVAAPVIVIPALHGALRGGLRKIGMLPIILGAVMLFASRPDF